MRVILYLTLEEVLELHKTLLQRFGGKHGVRDLGLLESALRRPQSGYYESLSLQTAALLQSLTQNHAFIDGNKRVAFAATAIFVRMNNFRLKVDADTAEDFIINDLIQKKVELEQIADWLEKYFVAIEK